MKQIRRLRYGKTRLYMNISKNTEEMLLTQRAASVFKPTQIQSSSSSQSSAKSTSSSQSSKVRATREREGSSTRKLPRGTPKQNASSSRANSFHIQESELQLSKNLHVQSTVINTTTSSRDRSFEEQIETQSTQNTRDTGRPVLVNSHMLANDYSTLDFFINQDFDVENINAVTSGVPFSTTSRCLEFAPVNPLPKPVFDVDEDDFFNYSPHDVSIKPTSQGQNALTTAPVATIIATSSSTSTRDDNSTLLDSSDSLSFVPTVDNAFDGIPASSPSKRRKITSRTKVPLQTSELSSFARQRLGMGLTTGIFDSSQARDGKDTFEKEDAGNDMSVFTSTSYLTPAPVTTSNRSSDFDTDTDTNTDTDTDTDTDIDVKTASKGHKRNACSSKSAKSATVLRKNTVICKNKAKSKSVKITALATPIQTKAKKSPRQKTKSLDISTSGNVDSSMDAKNEVIPDLSSPPLVPKSRWVAVSTPTTVTKEGEKIIKQSSKTSSRKDKSGVGRGVRDEKNEKVENGDQIDKFKGKRSGAKEQNTHQTPQIHAQAQSLPQTQGMGQRSIFSYIAPTFASPSSGIPASPVVNSCSSPLSSTVSRGIGENTPQNTSFSLLRSPSVSHVEKELGGGSPFISPSLRDKSLRRFSASLSSSLSSSQFLSPQRSLSMSFLTAQTLSVSTVGRRSSENISSKALIVDLADDISSSGEDSAVMVKDITNCKAEDSTTPRHRSKNIMKRLRSNTTVDSISLECQNVHQESTFLESVSTPKKPRKERRKVLVSANTNDVMKAISKDSGTTLEDLSEQLVDIHDKITSSQSQSSVPTAVDFTTSSLLDVTEMTENVDVRSRLEDRNSLFVLTDCPHSLPLLEPFVGETAEVLASTTPAQGESLNTRKEKEKEKKGHDYQAQNLPNVLIPGLSVSNLPALASDTRSSDAFDFEIPQSLPALSLMPVGPVASVGPVAPGATAYHDTLMRTTTLTNTKGTSDVNHIKVEASAADSNTDFTDDEIDTEDITGYGIPEELSSSFSFDNVDEATQDSDYQWDNHDIHAKKNHAKGTIGQDQTSVANFPIVKDLFEKAVVKPEPSFDRFVATETPICPQTFPPPPSEHLNEFSSYSSYSSYPRDIDGASLFEAPNLAFDDDEIIMSEAKQGMDEEIQDQHSPSQSCLPAESSRVLFRTEIGNSETDVSIPQDQHHDEIFLNQASDSVVYNNALSLVDFPKDSLLDFSLPISSSFSASAASAISAQSQSQSPSQSQSQRYIAERRHGNTQDNNDEKAPSFTRAMDDFALDSFSFSQASVYDEDHQKEMNSKDIVGNMHQIETEKDETMAYAHPEDHSYEYTSLAVFSTNGEFDEYDQQRSSCITNAIKEEKTSMKIRTKYYNQTNMSLSSSTSRNATNRTESGSSLAIFPTTEELEDYNSRNTSNTTIKQEDESETIKSRNISSLSSCATPLGTKTGKAQNTSTTPFALPKMKAGVDDIPLFYPSPHIPPVSPKKEMNRRTSFKETPVKTRPLLNNIMSLDSAIDLADDEETKEKESTNKEKNVFKNACVSTQTQGCTSIAEFEPSQYSQRSQPFSPGSRHRYYSAQPPNSSIISSTTDEIELFPVKNKSLTPKHTSLSTRHRDNLVSALDLPSTSQAGSVSFLLGTTVAKTEQVDETALISGQSIKPTVQFHFDPSMNDGNEHDFDIDFGLEMDTLADSHLTNFDSAGDFNSDSDSEREFEPETVTKSCKQEKFGDIPKFTCQGRSSVQRSPLDPQLTQEAAENKLKTYPVITASYGDNHIFGKNRYASFGASLELYENQSLFEDNDATMDNQPPLSPFSQQLSRREHDYSDNQEQDCDTDANTQSRPINHSVFHQSLAVFDPREYATSTDKKRLPKPLEKHNYRRPHSPNSTSTTTSILSSKDVISQVSPNSREHSTLAANRSLSSRFDSTQHPAVAFIPPCTSSLSPTSFSPLSSLPPHAPTFTPAYSPVIPTSTSRPFPANQAVFLQDTSSLARFAASQKAALHPVRATSSGSFRSSFLEQKNPTSGLPGSMAFFSAMFRSAQLHSNDISQTTNTIPAHCTTTSTSISTTTSTTTSTTRGDLIGPNAEQFVVGANFSSILRPQSQSRSEKLIAELKEKAEKAQKKHEQKAGKSGKSVAKSTKGTRGKNATVAPITYIDAFGVERVQIQQRYVASKPDSVSRSRSSKTSQDQNTHGEASDGVESGNEAMATNRRRSKKESGSGKDTAFETIPDGLHGYYTTEYGFSKGAKRGMRKTFALTDGRKFHGSKAYEVYQKFKEAGKVIAFASSKSTEPKAPGRKKPGAKPKPKTKRRTKSSSTSKSNRKRKD